MKKLIIVLALITFSIPAFSQSSPVNQVRDCNGDASCVGVVLYREIAKIKRGGGGSGGGGSSFCSCDWVNHSVRLFKYYYSRDGELLRRANLGNHGGGSSGERSCLNALNASP